jgi:hypothetical protein
MSVRRLAAALTALAAALAPSLALSQGAAPPSASGSAPGSAPRGMGLRVIEVLQSLQLGQSPELAAAINGMLTDTSAHVRMAPARVAAAADSARAREIVRTARAALAKYADVAAAERDGYVRFLPWLAEQSIYHYNHLQNVVSTLGAFDATRPASLLYRKDASGALALVGAMYVASPDATPEDLDARLPLGVAQWHEHVDFCGPTPEGVRAGTQRVDGPSLARWLAITTREACAEAGGRFVPRMFGWMAHVNLFEGSDDPRVVWGHGRDHMRGHRHP